METIIQHKQKSYLLAADGWHHLTAEKGTAPLNWRPKEPLKIFSHVRRPPCNLSFAERNLLMPSALSWLNMEGKVYIMDELSRHNILFNSAHNPNTSINPHQLPCRSNSNFQLETKQSTNNTKNSATSSPQPHQRNNVFCTSRIHGRSWAQHISKLLLR